MDERRMEHLHDLADLFNTALKSAYPPPLTRMTAALALRLLSKVEDDIRRLHDERTAAVNTVWYLRRRMAIEDLHNTEADR